MCFDLQYKENTVTQNLYSQTRKKQTHCTTMNLLNPIVSSQGLRWMYMLPCKTHIGIDNVVDVLFEFVSELVHDSDVIG